MNLTLSVPSKTFMLGEYAVLGKHTALLLNTLPCFELQIEAGRGITGIAATSPAGQLIAAQPAALTNLKLTFFDPHHGKGGLGASSAQFILCYALWHYLQYETLLPLTQPEQYQALLDCYHQYAWNGDGIPPSGADLIAQFHGGMLAYDPSNFQTTTYDWPFTDYGFFLLHTGNKMATHLHLQALKSYDWQQLGNITTEALTALQAKDAGTFTKSVTAYTNALSQLQLVDSNTQQQLNHLLQFPGILAAKGCGALGADVIFVFYHKQEKSCIEQLLVEQHVKKISDETDIAKGLTLEAR